jgi:LysM repeat protein
MLAVLRSLLVRVWVWLGGDLLPAGLSGVEPGPGQFVYRVRPGDTLRDIARHFSTSIWILAAVNDLDDFSQIHAGQPLLIPRPGAPLTPPTPHASKPVPPPHVELEEARPFVYIVRTDDTLSGIAGQFNVTPGTIIQTNRLPGSGSIWPGQRLLIPGSQVRPEREPSAPVFETGPEMPALQVEPGSRSVPASESEDVSGPDPNMLPGQRSYVVQTGDSLIAIARRFNVTVRAIIEANGIQDASLVQPGMRLIIPHIS